MPCETTCGTPFIVQRVTDVTGKSKGSVQRVTEGSLKLRGRSGSAAFRGCSDGGAGRVILRLVSCGRGQLLPHLRCSRVNCLVVVISTCLVAIDTVV